MAKFTIEVGGEIMRACPRFRAAAIECGVKNSPHNVDLWREIDAFCADFSAATRLEDINKRPAIAATRTAYKKLGKDPNRYRPSAEALCRRAVKGLGLYQIDTLVDLINLVSLKTGFSIGGFDADKIEGDVITLGVGRANERFEAIGRGLLNIEGLPVYRDAAGGIGTPTSDEERTKITPQTSRLLMIINGYSGEEGLCEAAEYAADGLRRYAGAEDGRIVIAQTARKE